MRDPYSLEAEHGLLGAMLQRPELIETLSDDITPESFYFPETLRCIAGSWRSALTAVRLIS